ncbi:MAG TPA: TatD family hydrolase [bacterium]
MIDCHSHLTSREFDADRAAVLQRAREAGVTHVAIVGQDAAENAGVLASMRTPAVEGLRLLPFLGLHPDRFTDDEPPITPEEIDAICAEIRLRQDAITGIGEVGLDHWRCKTEERRALQREAFVRLVDLAVELDLPLNVHSRSAGHHTLELLLERGAKRVLMHAFDGKAGHALKGAEAGYVFSIPPSIVRSEQKRKLVRVLPLKALALETDSPVLGPDPAQRNEPANLRRSLEAIAEIKGVAEVDVAKVTTETARRVFRIGEERP